MIKTTRFDRLEARDWKNDATSISLQDIKNNGLLIKTRRGAVVKVLILVDAQARIGGVFETTNSAGVFPY